LAAGSFIIGFALASVTCRSLAVVAGNKEVGDGKEIIGKFSGVVLAVILRAENHDPCASLVKEPLHELECEAAQSIAVGNHNLLDIASMDAPAGL
jgi:hypothetical protein